MADWDPYGYKEMIQMWNDQFNSKMKAIQDQTDAWMKGITNQWKSRNEQYLKDKGYYDWKESQNPQPPIDTTTVTTTIPGQNPINIYNPTNPSQQNPYYTPTTPPVIPPDTTPTVPGTTKPTITGYLMPSLLKPGTNPYSNPYSGGATPYDWNTMLTDEFSM